MYTNKTTTINNDKYKNSTFFLQQKRLAIQRNLQQLHKLSITRDIIRSKILILIDNSLILILSNN